MSSRSPPIRDLSTGFGDIKGIPLLKGTFVDVVRVYGRQWWRLALAQLLVLVGMTAIIVAVALLVQGRTDSLLAWIASDVDGIEARASGIAAGAIGAIALFTVPLQLAGVLATIRIADRSLDGKRPRFLGLVTELASRLLAMLGASAIALVLVLVALVGAPLSILVGLLGLVATGVIALVRRRRPAALTMWPGWRTWAFVAIPFAVLWRVSASAILTPIAVVLEPAGPLHAVRAADRAASGRRWKILGLFLAAVVASVAVSAAASWLGSAAWGEAGAVALGGVVQFFAVPLPIVVAVVLYRRAAALDGRNLGASRVTPASVARPRPASPVVARVATLVVATLVLSAGLAAGPLTAASPAAADPSPVAGSSVAYLVTSAVDTVDTTALDSQQASCLVAGPDCTFRAALALAQQAAAGGAIAATIGFATNTQIAVAAPLTFAPAAAAAVAGVLTIDAGAHSVTLDGGGTTQILSVTSEYWNLAIVGVTFRNGYGYGFGGALSAGVPQTRLDATVFQSNAASFGGAAVFARQLLVTASSFLNNQATGYTNSTFGGAIRATGRASVENSTFDGNGVGDAFTTLLNHGSDVYADGGMDVVNSTFVNSKGGSLGSQGVASTIRNSIFTSNWAGGGGACTGVAFTGGNNLSGERDSTCPGAGGGSNNFTLVGPRVDTGRVPVFPLTVIGNPAIGAGLDCPSVDALGIARPTNSCDLGAVEFDGKTSITVHPIADPAVFGTVTLRATVATPTGVVPQGSVSFTVAGVSYGPITLSNGTADVVVTGLARGALAYSADFAPAAAPLVASSTGTLSYEVEPVQVRVLLNCASPTAAECATNPWKVGDTGSIAVVATVEGDEHPGSAVIATDPEGTGIIGAATRVVGGTAAFTIPATTIGLGAHGLYAIFTSDDETYAGVSVAPQPLQVLRAPTVTLTGTASTGVYGDATKGTFTVRVSGAGPTPTGTVDVLGTVATLDANGVATIDSSTLAVNAQGYGLVARYAGDDVYSTGSSNTVAFRTTPADTSTAISSVSPAAPRFGDATTVTVIVRTGLPSTSDAQGSVQLVVDDTTTFGPVSYDPDASANGGEQVIDVVIPAGALSTGTHTVVAEFSGNANFTDSASSASGTMVVIAKAVTTTDLTTSASTMTWDGQVTLTATVDASASALAPDGLVKFTAGAANLGTATLIPCAVPNTDGCAVASITVAARAIGIGAVALGANYLGASNFATSSDEVTNTVIGKATPVVTVSGAGSVGYGDVSTYQIEVVAGTAAPADGTIVTVTAVPQTGAPITLGTVALTNGAGSVVVPTVQTLLPGTYAITAAFAGDAHFVGATGATSLTVASAVTDIDLDSLSGTSVFYGGSLATTITVKNTSGALAPEGDIVLSWMGHEVGRATLNAGDNTANSNVRTVQIDAVFGPPIMHLDTSWLTANFVAAPGFADSQLLTDAHEARRQVTVTPLQAKLSLDTTAVIGQPLAATATVAIVGDDLGIIPAGQVAFNVVTGSTGSVGPFYATVVDGTAILPVNLLVDVAGTWQVYAYYTPDALDTRYVSTSPNDFAQRQSFVAGGTAAVTVDAPATLELGTPLTLSVSVAGLLPATGTVTLRDGSVVVGDDVPLVNGRATVSTLLSADYRYGDYDFNVYYSGNGSLASARSADFTVSIGKVKTSIVVGTSSNSVELYPGIVGATVEYSARVAATRGVPNGIVSFYRDSTLIGADYSLDTSGVATITVTPDRVWSGDIVAVYQSGDGSMLGSTATLTHSWVAPPVIVTISGTASPLIGSAVPYEATVSYDWTDFRYQPTNLRPGQAPSGLVTISDGDGGECAVSITPDDASTQTSTGSCELAFTAAGNHTVTATYLGNALYGSSGTGTKAVNVLKGTPTLTIATDGTNWMGLTTVPVAWEVRGASSGTVTIKLGTVAVCTSSSMTGSCDVAIPRHGRIPAYGQPANADAFTLEYSGNAVWNAASQTLSGAIIACVPFQQPKANPAGTATVAIDRTPTCGDGAGDGVGSGYYTSDWLHVRVTATDGFSIRSVSDGWLPYSDSDTFYSSARDSAAVNIYPVARYAGTALLPLTITASTDARCVPVTFQVNGLADRLSALNNLMFETPWDCPAARASNSDNTVTASFKVGSQLRVARSPYNVPERTTFYGWSGKTGTEQFADSATFTVTADMGVIKASYGPVCYNALPNLTQPDGGILTTSLPTSNCLDPKVGTPGWTYGTRATGKLTDTGVTSTNRSFFDAWGGNTDRFTRGAAEPGMDSAGVRTTVHPFAFTITDWPFTISASYGRCVALKTAVIGDPSNGVPGTVKVVTTPDCPIGTGAGTGADTERWYRTGSSVTLTTASTTVKPTRTSLRFLGWSGLPLAKGKYIDETVTVALSADATATASYGTNANCRPFSVAAVPATAITLTTSFTNGANACSAMYGPKFYDQGIDGNGISVEATPATADAEGAEMVFAWASSELSDSGEAVDKSVIWKRTSSLNEQVYGNTDVVAYACEFVSIYAVVRDPSGKTSVAEAGASNVDPKSHTKLGKFVRTNDANCSTGADPRSGLGGYAWTVGTQLLPVVTANPVAYKFVKWSQDVTGTGDTPDAALNLVGAGHRAEGDNYHYKVTAIFDAICYTLSLPYDADKLEVITAPNCPGVDKSEKKYLGGTAVVLHAPDSGDTLFRNWVSGTDATDKDDPRWASVVMTSDKTVVPYYSTKSAGEQFTTYGKLVGDELAVASKKMVGFAAAAVSAYVKTIFSKVTLIAASIGYLAQGLELVGVHGAAIDAMKNGAELMGTMISLMWAPLDCISAWSSGGEDTAFYAAQNLIGTAIVSGLAGKAKTPPAQTFSTLDELKEKAKLLKGYVEPVQDAFEAIKGAKGVYDSAASGNVGWESSAYEAWGTQSGAAVFGTCMAGRTGEVMTSMDKLVP